VSKKYKFEPNYAVPPAETFIEILEDRKLSLMVFSEMVDVEFEELVDIIDAKKPIDERIANEFEKALKVPASFWLNLENNYQATLKRIIGK
jgi:HTH-type transcriptional regulator / antitoxin HigA